jgi:hypothetical protein
MGDLPGSPSVAPSPFFARLRGGREPRRASPDCPDSPGWCGTGLRGHPGASTRHVGGDRSVVNTTPEGGRNSRHTEAVSTPPYAGAVGGRGTYAFLSVFFLLFFSCFLPHFFAFLFFFRARGVAPGAQAAESDTGLRSRRFIPLRVAPPRRGEQTLGRVSDRAP